jgi:hypothetical protein
LPAIHGDADAEVVGSPPIGWLVGWLVRQVAALDASVRKGEKVAENDVVQVTELLMNELLKLDAVVADGDVKAQRRLQVS